MEKCRECEEIVKIPDCNKSYRFAGTLGFLRMLAIAGRDPSFVFDDLSNGLLPPEEIKNVIKFSVQQIDGVDVIDVEREDVAIEFIELAGLVDSSLLARVMMSNAMNGTVKKKQLMQSEMIQGMIISQKRSRWMILSLVGLSLGGSLAGLIALAWMIINYCVQLI